MITKYITFFQNGRPPKELEEKVESKSLMKMQTFDNIISNIINGERFLTKEQKQKVINLLHMESGERRFPFLEAKRKLFQTINMRGYIKSKYEMLDTMEIMRRIGMFV